jgi:hypothetical protein
MHGHNGDLRKHTVARLGSSAIDRIRAQSASGDRLASLTTNTPSPLEATVTCTGDQQTMTSHVHIDALPPTSIKGTANARSTGNRRTMTMNMTLTGRAVDADCEEAK